MVHYQELETVGMFSSFDTIPEFVWLSISDIQIDRQTYEQNYGSIHLA